MDKAVFYKLSSGLYIIGAQDQKRNVGCVVNTVTQSTSNPVTLTVCINKENFTDECIKKTGEFTVSILSEAVSRNVLAIFGFSSGKDKEKFSMVPYATTTSGLPYLSEGVCGYLECKVLESIDVFTHTLFIAEVVDGKPLTEEPALTYEYYHQVLKGKTPPKASSYIAE